MTSLLFLVSILICCIPVAVICASENGTIPAAHFTSAKLVHGIPPGWVLDRRAGKVNLRLEKAGEDYVVRLISDRESSFGIKRELRVDLREYPFLSWRWKALRLPLGGDVRKASTDDQAVQLYVAFTETGFPAALNTPVIGYVWDNNAPHGWTGRSCQIGGSKLRYVVVRNKTDRLGKWYYERRNVYEDFRRLFCDLREIDAVTYGIQFHINSQYTKSEAESCIGDVYFSRSDMKRLTASAPFPVTR